MITAVELLRWQFGVAHALLETSAEQLPDAYARVVLGEDLAINCVLAERMPLSLSTWRGQTGVSERCVEIDVAALRAYAAAVYAATDAYLATLTDLCKLQLRVLNGLLLTIVSGCARERLLTAAPHPSPGCR